MIFAVIHQKSKKITDSAFQCQEILRQKYVNHQKPNNFVSTVIFVVNILCLSFLSKIEAMTVLALQTEFSLIVFTFSFCGKIKIICGFLPPANTAFWMYVCSIVVVIFAVFLLMIL